MICGRAIHELWAGYLPLAQLIPADRIYTGLPPLRDETEAVITYPYASLTLEGEPETKRTSSGTLFVTELAQIAIWSPDYDAADRIERVAAGYFNRIGFAWSGGAVLDMKPLGRTETQSEDDGVWRIARVFSVRSRLNAGGVST